MAIAHPYRVTAVEAIRRPGFVTRPASTLLRLRFLGLLGLMMTDRSTHRSAGDSVPAADLVARDRSGRGPLAGTGGLLVRVGRRVGAHREAHKYCSQNYPSHRHPPIVVRLKREAVTDVAVRIDDRSVRWQKWKPCTPIDVWRFPRLRSQNAALNKGAAAT
jgi:hypothetical protein